MKEPKLSFKRKLRFALTVKTPFRLIFTIVLASASFLMLGLSFVFAFYDRDFAERNAFLDADEFFSVQRQSSEGMSLTEVKEITSALGQSYGVDRRADVVFTDCDREILKTYSETTHFSDGNEVVSHISEGFMPVEKILAGRIPTEKGEAMITSCTAMALLLSGEAGNFQELVGKTVNLEIKANYGLDIPPVRGEYVITGVYDSDCLSTHGYLMNSSDPSYYCHSDYNENHRCYLHSLILSEEDFQNLFPDAYNAVEIINGRDKDFRTRYNDFFGQHPEYRSFLIGNSLMYNDKIEKISRYFIFPAVFLSLFSVLLLYHMATVSIRRKREMIGCLRALGCRGRDVMHIFLLENGMIGIVTAGVSCAATAALIPTLNGIVKTSLETGVNYLFFHPAAVVLLILLCLAASLLSAIIPVLSESKKTPVDILKGND